MAASAAPIASIKVVRYLGVQVGAEDDALLLVGVGAGDDDGAGGVRRVRG